MRRKAVAVLCRWWLVVVAAAAVVITVFITPITSASQVLSYASIVRYLVYQQGKEIDLLVGTLRDHNIGTFTRSFAQ
jgi:hypothetical protein